jgi:hypothetical protein
MELILTPLVKDLMDKRTALQNLDDIKPD